MTLLNNLKRRKSAYINFSSQTPSHNSLSWECFIKKTYMRDNGNKYFFIWHCTNDQNNFYLKNAFLLIIIRISRICFKRKTYM